MNYKVTGIEYSSINPRSPGLLLRGADRDHIKRSLDAGRSLTVVSFPDKEAVPRCPRQTRKAAAANAIALRDVSCLH